MRKEKKKKPQGSQRVTLCSQDEYPHKDITGEIISCGIEVHSKLGPGLLESIYEEALAFEFELRNISYERQRDIFRIQKLKDGITRLII